MQRLFFWIFTNCFLLLGYLSYDAITLPDDSDLPISETSSEVVIEKGDSYLTKVTDLIGDPLDFSSGSLTKAGASIEQNRSALIKESTIITYKVTDGALSDESINYSNTKQQDYAKDTLQHNELWDSFTTIIPSELRSNVKSFSIFSDGTSNLLGYVEPLDYAADTWQLGVDFADSTDKKNFYYTLIHEYGHLLTLGNDQMVINYDWSTSSETESTYSSFYGESTPDSYMNLYYKEFWLDYYKEWQHLDVQNNVEAQKEFYLQHPDDFLTTYAVVHPEEDIAESWTFFILSTRQENTTVAQEKQNFFYQFPELIEIRTHILENLLTEVKKD